MAKKKRGQNTPDAPLDETPRDHREDDGFYSENEMPFFPLSEESIFFQSTYDNDELPQMKGNPYFYGNLPGAEDGSSLLLVNDYAPEQNLRESQIVPSQPPKVLKSITVEQTPKQGTTEAQAPVNIENKKNRKIKRSKTKPQTAVQPEEYPPTEQTEKGEAEQQKTEVLQESKKRDILPFLRKGAIIVAVAVMLWSLYDIASRVIGYQKAEVLYTDMQNIFYDGADASDHIRYNGPSLNDRPTVDLRTALSGEYTGKQLYEADRQGEFAKMLPRLEELSKINEDLFGWVKIGGTRIDYPVVKGTDNDYYLTHTFGKTELKNGSIFADFRLKNTMAENRNIVIYGHNMKDGSMFSALMEFEKEAVFRGSRIKLYTKDGIFEFTPFSVHVADPEYPFFETDFKDDNDFMDYIKDMRNLSIFKSGIQVRETDQVITLMTCTNTIVNRRLVVHAVLTSQTK